MIQPTTYLPSCSVRFLLTYEEAIVKIDPQANPEPDHIESKREFVVIDGGGKLGHRLNSETREEIG